MTFGGSIVTSRMVIRTSATCISPLCSDFLFIYLFIFLNQRNWSDKVATKLITSAVPGDTTK